MIYLAIDDTDNAHSRGTGHLARLLAQELDGLCRVEGITRHQLFLDPRVPYTAKNSCAALHLDDDGEPSLDDVLEISSRFVREQAAAGSDPAICLMTGLHPDLVDFGRRAQTSVLTPEAALALAEEHGVALHSLAGTQEGIVGALAGAALAASGHDGRFILRGSIRELAGRQTIDAICAAGVAEVRELDGRRVRQGTVETGGKLRPAFRNGRCVLYVRRDGQRWLPLKLD